MSRYVCGSHELKSNASIGEAWRSSRGVCELELEPPIQLLVLNEEVGLAKLDVHPTLELDLLLSVGLLLHKDWCDHPSNT
ncbi:unnamed protein product [Microthlaspi erraticum]|uniref:Uncharacterized protein n=1 Tax=Microthlaspi erraticum TaxID=1685480 RepID=A0A6D2JDE1_9BRAS|nr:unnamed protein product [Microthlaspi erraticum]